MPPAAYRRHSSVVLKKECAKLISGGLLRERPNFTGCNPISPSASFIPRPIDRFLPGRTRGELRAAEGYVVTLWLSGGAH